MNKLILSLVITLMAGVALVQSCDYDKEQKAVMDSVTEKCDVKKHPNGLDLGHIAKGFKCLEPLLQKTDHGKKICEVMHNVFKGPECKCDKLKSSLMSKIMAPGMKLLKDLKDKAQCPDWKKAFGEFCTTMGITV